MLPTSGNSISYQTITLETCRNVLGNCLTAVDDRIGDLFKMIPQKLRVSDSLVRLNSVVTGIPLVVAWYYGAISFSSYVCINTALAGIIRRGANCYAREIRQVIANSHLEKENKKGVALILNASKWRDFNESFRDDERHLEEVKLIAKKFLIKSETITTPDQLSKTIEDVCNKNEKPVKLVIIRGHGSLKSISLGLFSEIKSDDTKLVEALKKTDEYAHIILQSCSTGKLRTEEGISFADQLSLNLPNRMVTGHSKEAAATLIEHNDYPQGITLLGLNSKIMMEQNMQSTIPIHSFRIINNQRTVTTLLPANHLEDLIDLSDPKTKRPLMKKKINECKSDVDIDNAFKTDQLTNKYKYSNLDIRYASSSTFYR